MSEQIDTQVRDEQTESAQTTPTHDGPSDVTPYQAAKIATKWLRKHGKIAEDQEIAPQTMYSNKAIERYGKPRTQGGQGVYFVGASFMQWLQNWGTGGTGARGRVNIEALANEYMADLDNLIDQDERVQERRQDAKAEVTEPDKSESESETTEMSEEELEQATNPGRHASDNDNE